LKAEIFNHKFWLKNQESEKIKSYYDDLLTDCGFTILNFTEHTFENGGYTALWLLAESHLAIHTFPEEDKMYIELSGCNQTMTDKFENIINKHYTKEDSNV
jgi:S-adenosylmethionine decarboxylase